MRPQKLTMSAFGPFARKTTLDFELLGDNGIYLVTGDTGAGKTTIFDAIMFALYGEASGDLREASMFRSQYADINTPTEVELQFLYRDKTYIVKRNPAYERINFRDQGKTTKESANAELFCPDDKTHVTGSKNVTNEIEKIMGVNYKQYRQIAMLAQGEFMKLLFTDLKDRQEVFRHVFQTQPFLNLQKKLGDEFKTVKEEYNDIKNSIAQYISGIVTENEDELSNVRDRIKGVEGVNDVIIDKITQLLKDLNDKDSVLSNEMGEEIKQIEKELEFINTNIGKIETKENIEKSIEDSKKDKKEETERNKELEKEFKAQEGNLPLKNKYEEEKNKLENELPLYSELNELVKSINELNKQHTAENEIYLRKEKEHLDCDDEIQNLENEQVKLSDAGELRQKLVSKQENLAERMKKTRELLALLEDINDAENYLGALLKENNSLGLESKKRIADYERKHSAFLAGQAFIISETLLDGEPCPVCGSTSHPRPAERVGEVPDEEQVKAAKIDMENARANKDANDIKCTSKKAEINAMKNNIGKQLSELGIKTDYENVSEVAESKLISLEKEKLQLDDEIKKADGNVRRKSELNKLIPEKIGIRSSLKEELESIKKKIAVLESEIKQKEIQRKNHSEKLQYEDEQEAKKKLNELCFKINKMKEDYDTAKNKHTESSSKLNALETSIQRLKEQLTESLDLNKDDEIQKRDKLKDKKKELEGNNNEIVARLVRNRDVLKKIGEKNKKFKKATEKYSWLNDLSDTANGTLAQKPKVNLETYVQMMLFDRITDRANIYLMGMTDNRYELKRSNKFTEQFKKESLLDLNVIDRARGGERDAKTLSGGEKFKAALSLALGLSDEIQASSGGVRIDTLFIDEGFGSLDINSRKQAMQTLTDLAKGDRLIGIISHVEELKDRVEKKIIVEAEVGGGSKATIVVDK